MEPNDLSYQLIQVLAHAPKLLRPPYDVEIRPTEGMTLGCIWHMTKCGEQAITPSELGKMLQISRPAVTAQLNRLERLGYVRREIDPHDKRRVQVLCTEKGEAILHNGCVHIQRVSSILIQALGQEKIKELINLLQQASQALAVQPEMDGFPCGHPSAGEKGETI